MNQHVWKKLLVFALTTMLLLTGCHMGNRDLQNSGTALAETGFLMLRVNPEIEIEYDKQGNVTQVTGKNEDGKKVVNGYTDYQGKACGVVLEELIGRINDAGYFTQSADGSKKNIILQIEPGSPLPTENFFQEISTDVQTAVSNLHLSSHFVTIDSNDYDQKYQQGNTASPYITLEKAQEIALTDAGIGSGDAWFEDREFDFDDGYAVYELEFTAGGYEYDYDIDAKTGEILKSQVEKGDGVYTDDDSNRFDSSTSSDQNGYLSLEEAKAIALQDAGVNSADAWFEERDFDWEHGYAVYELEFNAGGYEYDYDIDAETGRILKSQVEKDDGVYSDDDLDRFTSVSGYISLDEAKSIALNDAGVDSADVQFADRDFDFDDGYAVYELEFYANGNEYDYDIDAETGNILKSQIEKNAIGTPSQSGNTNSNNSSNQSSQYISAEEAKSIALQDAGVNSTDAWFKEAKLDRDDGKMVYELEFYAGGNEYDYEIDAETGNIWKAEKDRAD